MRIHICTLRQHVDNNFFSKIRELNTVEEIAPILTARVNLRSLTKSLTFATATSSNELRMAKDP